MLLSGGGTLLIALINQHYAPGVMMSRKLGKKFLTVLTDRSKFT
jgi:hypothetical protein